MRVGTRIPEPERPAEAISAFWSGFVPRCRRAKNASPAAEGDASVAFHDLRRTRLKACSSLVPRSKPYTRYDSALQVHIGRQSGPNINPATLRAVFFPHTGEGFLHVEAEACTATAVTRNAARTS